MGKHSKNSTDSPHQRTPQQGKNMPPTDLVIRPTTGTIGGFNSRNLNPELVSHAENNPTGVSPVLTSAGSQLNGVAPNVLVTNTMTSTGTTQLLPQLISDEPPGTLCHKTTVPYRHSDRMKQENDLSKINRIKSWTGLKKTLRSMIKAIRIGKHIKAREDESTKKTAFGIQHQGQEQGTDTRKYRNGRDGRTPPRRNRRSPSNSPPSSSSDSDRSRRRKRSDSPRGPSSSDSSSSSEDRNPRHRSSKRTKRKESLPWRRQKTDAFVKSIRTYSDKEKRCLPSQVKTYDGKGDPDDHLNVFETVATNENWPEAIWCRQFNSTLVEHARTWFDKLPKRSIGGYEDLRRAFMKNFTPRKKCVKNPVELARVKQRQGETTDAFMDRYKDELLQVKNCLEILQISGFMNGINNQDLIKKLNDKIPSTFDETMKRTRSFVQGEAAAAITETRKSFLAKEQVKQSDNTNQNWKANYKNRRRENANKLFTSLIMTPKEILAALLGLLYTEHIVGHGSNDSFKKARSWDFGLGRPGPPYGVHRFTRPFCRRCAPGLNWLGRASGAVTLKKLECSKQAYALYTLAWDNIRRTTAKAFAKDVFINQERKLGARRRSDTVLVSTINDADQGSADVAYRTPLAPYREKQSLGFRLFLDSMGGGAWPFLVGGAICLVNSVNERDLSLLTSYVEIIAIVGLKRGIPSKRESSARVDYVPALCTHRPSLLPIEWSGEVGRRSRNKVSVGEPAEGSLSNPAKQNDP
ncbi:reverse transcriptase domain-containing protein [Tanacetum coccineum]